MEIDGYKILWGLSPTDEAGVHPVNAAYNSAGATVPGASMVISDPNATSFALPADFWVDSFAETGVYFRLVKYLGSQIGTKSKVIEICSHGRVIQKSSGLNPISRPLDDGNTYTLLSFIKTAVNDKASMVFWRQNNKFVSLGKTFSGVDFTPTMGPTTGAIISTTSGTAGTALVFVGTKWGE